MNLNLSFRELEAFKHKSPKQHDYIVNAWPIFHTANHKQVAFLLLTSDTDMHLLQDAKDFQVALEQSGHFVRYTHVPKTTHFSIRKRWDSQNHHVFRYVSDFLNERMDPKKQ